MGCSSSRTAPLWLLSTGCSPSGTYCSSAGHPQATVLARKPDPVCAPLHGPQLPGDCSSMGSPWAAVPFRASLPALVGSSMGCRNIAYMAVVFSMGCKGISAPVPGVPPPPPSLTGVCRAVSLMFSHSFLTAAVVQPFYPFLNTLPQRCHQCCSRAQLWPAAGLPWSWLELALSDMGAAPGLSSQRPPLQPPPQTLPHEFHTDSYRYSRAIFCFKSIPYRPDAIHTGYCHEVIVFISISWLFWCVPKSSH